MTVACTAEVVGCSVVNELPSVALTRRFLALCEHHGSQRLAVRLIARGRNVGVPGLPASDDWTAWDAEQMQAGIDYLEKTASPIADDGDHRPG